MYIDRYNLLPAFDAGRELDLDIDVYPADPVILNLLMEIDPKISKETDKLTLLINTESFTNISDYAKILSKRKNVILLVNETIEPAGIDSMFYPVWQFATSSVNSNVQINSKMSKPYLADVLLGGATPNRKLMFDALKTEGLLENCLVNFFKRQTDWHAANDSMVNYRSDALEELDIKQINKAFDNNKWFAMISMTKLPGQVNFLAQRIASKVYENSYITVVTETETGQNLNYLTEKTFKPLIGKRPFLLHCNKGSLAHVKSLGFKTFSNWIDESYDNLSGHQRIIAIIEELKKFNNLNKDRVLSEMKEVFAHNFALCNDHQYWTKKLLDKCLPRMEHR